VEGFSDAVDGYFDVEDQLSRDLLHRADDLLTTEADRLSSLDSRSDVEAHREYVRSAFRSRIGDLPDRPNDPTVETTGRHQRDGYSVEMVVFESRPNFHVTANCYVPDGDGPHPAVLFLCGHADPAKADVANQKACIELALHGFVVFIVDPIGQGERKQYGDVELDGTVVSGGGGTFPHCYAGQKCFYAGSNLVRYMVNDDRCALDYLLRRNDVDDDRIGVTGTSGGGTQTLYLSLVDERVDVAAPCCSVSERYEQLKTGGRTHAEQAISGSVAQGIDYDDLVAAMAPRPVCIGAAASDKYFPIEGVHGTVDRVRHLYGIYDAEERVNLVVGDATHCSVTNSGTVCSSGYVSNSATSSTHLTMKYRPSTSPSCSAHPREASTTRLGTNERSTI
jgi:dienelactone hydrolase